MTTPTTITNDALAALLPRRAERAVQELFLRAAAPKVLRTARKFDFLGDVDDLVQIANMTLIHVLAQARSSWDPSRAKWTTYADVCAKFAIINFGRRTAFDRAMARLDAPLVDDEDGAGMVESVPDERTRDPAEAMAVESIVDTIFEASPTAQKYEAAVRAMIDAALNDGTRKAASLASGFSQPYGDMVWRRVVAEAGPALARTEEHRAVATAARRAVAAEAKRVSGAKRRRARSAAAAA